MDFRIGLIPISVTGVDRAKAFHGDTVGWTVTSSPNCSGSHAWVR
jgi:hypothetical protein